MFEVFIGVRQAEIILFGKKKTKLENRKFDIVRLEESNGADYRSADDLRVSAI